MTTRLHTQDPTKRLTYLGVRQRAIREHLLRRLTEKQYRRVALLYGFDGEPMSQREVAEVGGVAQPTVLESKEQVLSKLSQNVYLWLLWVGRKLFNPIDSYGMRDRGKTRVGMGDVGHLYDEAVEEGTRKAEALQHLKNPAKIAKAFREGDYETLHEVYGVGLVRTEPGLGSPGYSGFSPRPGTDAWESDRYHPESRYDRQVDELNEKYETGQITRIEWEVELLLAYVEDQNPKASEFRMDDLRQELEWAFGGQELGIYSEEKTQQLVSAALRSYVNRE